MTELGVYTRYSALGASSRLRYLCYADRLAQSGIDARFHTLFQSDYLRMLYSGRSAKFKALRDLGLRMLRMPPRERKLWIEYELLPWVPFAVEAKFLAGKRYVLDFDDAVYLKYAKHPRLADKFERLAAQAAGVVVANDALFDHFSKVNTHTVKIPTAVDTVALVPREDKFRRLTLVWIGTPVTSRAHLATIADTLRELKKSLDFDLLVIGGVPTPELDFAGVRIVPWSETAERELLPKCHIGIMPLPAGDAFASGKSAYKLIQYLAAGLPSVASPVGENRIVIDAGRTGFFADSPEEWHAALRKLAGDAVLRAAMGANARHAAQKYSRDQVFAEIATFLDRTLELRTTDKNALAK